MSRSKKRDCGVNVQKDSLVKDKKVSIDTFSFLTLLQRLKELLKFNYKLSFLLTATVIISINDLWKLNI